ncbi:MAG: azurin [Bacteroidota bacterium]
MNIRFSKPFISRPFQLSFIILFAFLYASCESKPKKEEANAHQNAVETHADSGETDGVVELTINSTDQMLYDKEELIVPAGATITLTLNHTGELPKKIMGHNLVILKAGTNIESFIGDAYSAVANDYIPDSDQMIAYTKLIGGGETTTITFEAPAKGSYDFVCSFPGHSMIMKGKFIVR